MVLVQEADFNVQALYQDLCIANDTGAVAMFVGRVRQFTEQVDQDASFLLEHYPGMTERNIEKIVTEAKQRWPLLAVTVVHRVGELRVDDQIVFVGVSSAHRAEAFQACDFIMDYLKSRAAFWKKETSQGQSHWVEAKAADEASLERWSK
ncbi:molybdenum cofactor biosynthesis protein MoaE [Maribrevibacterium harenarium]|uniref:Molybdopterin synthase catalytic subunit n=1 Tax=Maribrevibacterium harenarium TaxID=2589817 RepID=A0A501X5C3_9GAMM|nr:molybdenum cofactor biosynthesis protein MoaE [Maribrevibacterium harenarium]TPE55643.1 molybdenum cofactor biosynthesis protein MoaE [Maribrevibacterium harenarium]